MTKRYALNVDLFVDAASEEEAFAAIRSMVYNNREESYHPYQGNTKLVNTLYDVPLKESV